MTRLVLTAIAAFMMLSSNINAEQNRIELGLANIIVAKASATEEGDHDVLPGIVVRIFPEQGAGETFAVSNEVGIIVVLLRPGHYCYEAFDLDGVAVALDPKQETCFPIKADQTTNLGVAVRADR